MTITKMELMELARNTDDAGVDFLREGVRVLAQALMEVEVGNQIGAAHGEPRRPTQPSDRRCLVVAEGSGSAVWWMPGSSCIARVATALDQPLQVVRELEQVAVWIAEIHRLDWALGSRSGDGPFLQRHPMVIEVLHDGGDGSRRDETQIGGARSGVSCLRIELLAGLVQIQLLISEM